MAQKLGNARPATRGGKRAPAAPAADPTLVAEPTPPADAADVTEPTPPADAATDAPATDAGEGEGEGEGEATTSAPATNGRGNRVAPVAQDAITDLYRGAVNAAVVATTAAAADAVPPANAADIATVVDAQSLALYVAAVRTHTSTRANVMRDASSVVFREIQASRDLVAMWAAPAVNIAATDALAAAANPGRTVDHVERAAGIAVYHADMMAAADRVMAEWREYCAANAVDETATVVRAAAIRDERSADATEKAIAAIADRPTFTREVATRDWAACDGLTVTYTAAKVQYRGTLNATGGITCGPATSAAFVPRDGSKAVVTGEGDAMRVAFGTLSRAIAELRPLAPSGKPYAISGPDNWMVDAGQGYDEMSAGDVAANAAADAGEGEGEGEATTSAPAAVAAAA